MCIVIHGRIWHGPAYMGVALSARQGHSPRPRHLGIAAVVRLRARCVAQHGVAVVRRQSFWSCASCSHFAGCGDAERLWCTSGQVATGVVRDVRLAFTPQFAFCGYRRLPGLLRRSCGVGTRTRVSMAVSSADAGRPPAAGEFSGIAAAVRLKALGVGAARCASGPEPGSTALASGAAPCPRASCAHLPGCRRRGRKGGPEAPAGLTSLACDAEPCHRAG